MKPILFNTDMVRAILDGRKTVTRRVIKPQPSSKMPIDHNVCKMPIMTKEGVKHLWYIDAVEQYPFRRTRYFEKLSPYEVGDILYVRETWTELETVSGVPYYAYKSDDQILHHSAGENFKKWKPSIHMPKEAARLFLRVTGVRVERLQDIITGDYRSPLNINKEGLIEPCCICKHINGDCKDYIADNTCLLVDKFVETWNSTVKKSDLRKYSWNANPWVWVIEFEKMSKEIAKKER